MFSSHPFWTSSSLDVPAGVTQEEGHTGFLIHLPSAVRALIFVARRIQPFLSLVDREVEFCASAKKETRTAPSNESSVTQSSLVDSHSVNNRDSCIDDSAIRYHKYYHRDKQFHHEFPRNTKNLTPNYPAAQTRLPTRHRSREASSLEDKRNCKINRKKRVGQNAGETEINKMLQH